MNEKEQQLSFEKGITNIPSDALCSDNALAYEVNMVYSDGEHKVIQTPQIHINKYIGCNEMPHFLYIHKTTRDMYIGYFPSRQNMSITFGYLDSQNTYVHVQTALNLKYTNETRITSIGKTLIISDKDGMHYYTFRNGTYWLVGNNIPHLKASAHLYHHTTPGKIQYWIRNSQSYDGILIFDRDNHIIKVDPDCPPEKYNDYVIGLYSKNKKAVANKKGFCEPFFIRFALELFDGSYTYITNPILLLPFIKDNTYLDAYGGWTENRISVVTDFCQLYVSQEVDYTQFSDVVKDVVMFATDGISLYDTTIDQELHWPNASEQAGFFWGTITGNQTTNYQHSVYQSRMQGGSCLVKRQVGDIENDIKSASVFYKVASLGIKPFSGCVSEKIGEHVLENITTQEVLAYDDYYSRCDISAEIMHSYNSRLNIANISRGFFNGYDFFMVCDDEEPSSYDYYVTIRTDIGDVVVHHHVDDCYQKQGYYFYYPDSRATKVVILQKKTGSGEETILDANLVEHAGLNGAFYFAGMPGETMPERETGAHGSTTVTTNPSEQLPNYVVTSEVNNPFVFKAEGYNKVGTGKIIGMSTITQALSQGQFGQFPLLVFSESGIWAMSLDNTGLFVSIHPMSREVCNNSDSITQTDGAVFFTSEKGLMVVAGSDVNCVSEQMRGKIDTFAKGLVTIPDFKDVIKNCNIAYDYRDSLLWLLIKGFPGSYIYNIKTGTFSMRNVPIIENIINNYPDTLIQAQTGEVYSLLNRPNINDDSSTSYGGMIITRPMKFENALALKTLLQVRHITNMDGTLKLRIFASNNLNKWVELHSLGGMPWKYYRFAYSFENMMATDRFAGSVVITQERRTDKIR